MVGACMFRDILDTIESSYGNDSWLGLKTDEITERIKDNVEWS